MSRTDPWAEYWQADRPGSCIALSCAEDEAELAAVWAGFAGSLPAGTRVLDLATGNGVVPGYLLRANSTLKITAMDRAPIDPHRYLSASGHLRGVAFLGGLELAEAPGRLGVFPAVTSQFGIEYAPLEVAARALAGVLAPEGRFLLILHHAESDVVRPRRRDLAELERLLAAGAPGSALEAFARGELDGPGLEASTRAYLAGEGYKSRRLSGALVSAIDALLASRERGDGGWARQAEDVHARLLAEAERLRELLAAALDSLALERFVETLSRRGLVVEEAADLVVGRARSAPALLGWRVAGKR